MPSSSRHGRATSDDPSLTISSRQVRGVSRALARASPLSVWGLGLPRLTFDEIARPGEQGIRATGTRDGPAAIDFAERDGSGLRHMPRSSAASAETAAIPRNRRRSIESLMIRLPSPG